MTVKTWASVMPSFTSRHAAASFRYPGGAHAVNGAAVKQAKNETPKNGRIFITARGSGMSMLVEFLDRANGMQLSSVQTP
ncbi:hypothetical protein [Xanthomonas sacchari]|uniref:hypothetical protein n=1 Tax=Xanthomonas sacchari TaxID=56458 RepID=UPI003B20E81E